MPRGMLADGKEHSLGAMRRQGGQDGRRIARPRPVIERQYDFARPQEIVTLEVLETEAGAPGGVDLNNPRNTERVGIAGAGSCGSGGGGGRQGSGRRRRS